MSLKEDVIVIVFVVLLLAIWALCAWVLTLFFPLWFLLSVVLAIGIYYFDYLPLQHYWNPRVRALYPRRQWKVERYLLKRLHTAKLFIPRPTPALPMELWEIILKHAIHIPFMFDTTCEPQYLHRFITAQLNFFIVFEYGDSERDRKTLRLVCRSWNSILMNKKSRWTTADKAEEWKISRGTERIHFNHMWGDPRGPNPENPYRLAVENERSSSLSTISVQSYIHTISHMESSFSILFDEAEKLPSLRSLVYVGNLCSITPTVLQGIEHSFASLTVLVVQCPVIQGQLTLERLQVLYVNIEHIDLGQWWFPSLQHAAVGEKVQQVLIPGQVNNIQSLLLYGTRGMTATDDFWKDYSSLQFLGVSSKTFHIVDNPPVDHPLSYLYFTESEGGIEEMNAPHVADTLSRLLGLKTVTLPTSNANELESMYPAEWMTLYKQSERRGLKWLDKGGKEIVYRKKKRDASQQWFDYVLLAIQLIFGINVAVWFWSEKNLLPDWLAENANFYTAVFSLWVWQRDRILQIGTT